LSLDVHRVLMLPPFFYKNVTDQGIFDAFASTIERVNDDRLRLFLYLIPQMTGIEMSADLVERLHQEFPTIVTGLKDSSGNWSSTETLCRRLGASMYVMVGTEALLLRAMHAGASGCISATANVAAQSIIALYDKRNDPSAASLEHGVNATRVAFEAFPLIPALKTYMALTSGVSAWRNVRPPLSQLTATETSQLLSRVQELR
jgi:4-hydroxy-tetrahydrodipicolinate synthase